MDEFRILARESGNEVREFRNLVREKAGKTGNSYFSVVQEAEDEFIV